MPEVSRSFTDLYGPLTLRVQGGNAPVRVIADPQLTSPQVTVRGSRQDLDRLGFDTRPGQLGVSVPEQAPSAGGGGTVTNVNTGNVQNFVQTPAITGGLTFGDGGETTIGGVQQPRGAPAQPLEVEARVPAHSSVAVTMKDSPITVDGQFGGLHLENTSGNIQVNGQFRNCRAESRHGNISYPAQARDKVQAHSVHGRVAQGTSSRTTKQGRQDRSREKDSPGNETRSRFGGWFR